MRVSSSGRSGWKRKSRSTHAFFDAHGDQIEEIGDPFLDVIGRLALAHVPGACPHVERLGVREKERENECVALVAFQIAKKRWSELRRELLLRCCVVFCKICWL